MPAKVVVVGSFNTDLVLYMPELPKPGETVNGHRFVTGSGGKGSNQAVAAARLGADVTFIGRVGKDPYADVGLNLWQQEGINTDYVARDAENATGIASIFVDDSGENVIALALGANMALSPANIDAAREVIASADILLTQLEMPQETALYALKVAREYNVPTILNPAPVNGPLPDKLLQYVSYLTPNQTEVEHLSGQYGGDASTLAREVLAYDDQMIVLTMGSSGAMLVRKDSQEQIPAFKVDAVDTVGGGDAFNAGLAVALAEGHPIQEAIRFANATAGLAVTKKGAAASMPHRDEVDAFLAKHRTD